MAETRDLFQLQCTAQMKRADTAGQLRLRDALDACGYSDTTIIIELERKFFLNRNQSNLVLNIRS